jgi:hypothetical protein
LLAAYLDGQATPEATAAIERELAVSAESRRQVEQLRAIRGALGGPIPELESVDLVPLVRLSILSNELGEPSPEPSGWVRRLRNRMASSFRSLVTGRPRMLRWGALAAAIACIPLGVGFLRGRREAEEFRVKGDAPREPDGTDRDRWSGVDAFHVGSVLSGEPRRLGDRLPRGDGLLFSYSNLGPQPFAYLMIFAVDAQGSVRWFHPAYEREGTDPASIPITKGEANVPLPELIHHDWPPGALSIHVLFSRKPLRVSQVEALLARRAPDTRPAAALARLDGASVRVLATRVDP